MFIVLKVHVYVLSRKNWVLSETNVIPLILPGNIPSCIFGKILFTALVCILLWFLFQICLSHKRLWGNCCQFIVNFHNIFMLPWLLLSRVGELSLEEVYGLGTGVVESYFANTCFSIKIIFVNWFWRNTKTFA